MALKLLRVFLSWTPWEKHCFSNMTRMIFSCPLSSSLKYTVACYRRDVKCDLATFPDSQQGVCLHILTSDTILSFYFQCGKYPNLWSSWIKCTVWPSIMVINVKGSWDLTLENCDSGQGPWLLSSCFTSLMISFGNLVHLAQITIYMSFDFTF